MSEQELVLDILEEKQEANATALLKDMANYLNVSDSGGVVLRQRFKFETIYVFGDFLRPQLLQQLPRYKIGDAQSSPQTNYFFNAIVTHLCAGEMCFKTLHGQVRTFVNPLGNTALCMYLRLQKRIQTEQCANYAKVNRNTEQTPYMVVKHILNDNDKLYIIADIYHDNYTHESIEIEDVKRFQAYYKQVCKLQKTQTPHVVTPPQGKITGYKPDYLQKFEPPPPGISSPKTPKLPAALLNDIKKPTPKLPAALLNDIKKPTPNTSLPPKKPTPNTPLPSKETLMDQIKTKDFKLKKPTEQTEPQTPLPPQETFLSQIKKGIKLKPTPKTKASETQVPPAESQDTYDHFKNSPLLDAVRNAYKSDSDNDSESSSVDFEAQLVKGGDLPKIRL